MHQFHQLEHDIVLAAIQEEFINFINYNLTETPEIHARHFPHNQHVIYSLPRETASKLTFLFTKFLNLSQNCVV